MRDFNDRNMSLPTSQALRGPRVRILPDLAPFHAFPPFGARNITQERALWVLVTRTGFIDHIGLGVPDLAAAKRYYDELMPILGLRQWFPTTAFGEFNYGPDGARGPQIFFYQALEANTHSRHGTGLQHLSFMVASRSIVREAHDWAVEQQAVIVHAPREFPEYGEHYATYFLDPHGFMLEAVCHSREESA